MKAQSILTSVRLRRRLRVLRGVVEVGQCNELDSNFLVDMNILRAVEPNRVDRSVSSFLDWVMVRGNNVPLSIELFARLRSSILH